MLAGIGAGGQFTCNGCIGKHPGIIDQCLDRLYHFVHGALQNAGFIFGAVIQNDVGVTGCNLVGSIYTSGYRPADGAGDHEPHDAPQNQRHRQQAADHQLIPLDNRCRFSTALVHQFGLVIDQFVNRCQVSGLAGTDSGE